MLSAPAWPPLCPAAWEAAIAFAERAPVSQSGHDGQARRSYKAESPPAANPSRSLRMPRHPSSSPKRRARVPRWAAVLSGCSAALKALPQLLGLGATFPRPDLSRVERLVFVCDANLYRGAFAHALCAQSGLKAASFGLHTQTGRRSPAAAVRAAAALGVALESHRATHLRDFLAAPGDFYLLMGPGDVERLQRRGFPADRMALLGQWCRLRRLGIGSPHHKGEKHIGRCFAVVRAAVANLERDLCRARQGAAGTPGAARDCDAAAI